MRIRMSLLALLGTFALLTSLSMAQGQAPEKPEGVMLTAEDHLQNVGQVTMFDFDNPAAGIEGFQTFWPDGTVIMSLKLKDGKLVHNLGRWRIDGEKFCTTWRLPPDSKEGCIRSYKTGDNAYQAWREDGAFAAYWRFRR